MGHFAFLSPLCDLGATYDVHLKLIGKLVVDFLLVLTELFLIGATADVLRMNIDENWQFHSKGSRLTQNFTKHSSQKTRLSDLLYGIEVWTHHFHRAACNADAV